MRNINLLIIILCSIITAAGAARAQGCPEEDPLQHYTGTGTVVCPCFVEGEEAGAVFEAPADHYPIQILRVGIGWGSQFGGGGQQSEEYIYIYEGGLPNPGLPSYMLPGPVLTDGAINEFNIGTYLGDVQIDSGPFTVTLKFLFDNAGDPYAPSVVHDGNGCQSGVNVVKAIPGGWFDACVLGVTGDWVFYVIYKRVNCTTGIDDYYMIGNAVAALGDAYPNPFSSRTRIEFYVTRETIAHLNVYNIEGRLVSTIAERAYLPGRYSVNWDGRDSGAQQLASGVYFIELRAGSQRSVKKVLLTR
jgi:hypothetical protein